MPTPIHEAKADLFRALAHPARVRVLELLLDGPRQVADLITEVGLEPSSMSHQLAVLRRAGLVTSQRRGTTVEYALGAEQVAELMRTARGLLTSVLTTSEELLGQMRAEAAAE